MNLTTELLNIKNEVNVGLDYNLTDEEFCFLLILFPVFKVAQADGVYDEDEKQFMFKVSENIIAPTYSELDNEEIKQLVEELLGTIESLINKENVLLKGLKILCKSYEGLENQISSLMKEIANSSEGISQKELDSIRKIEGELLSID